MTFEAWLTAWMQFFIVIPSAISCYLVMGTHLRYSRKKTVLLASVLLGIYTVTGAAVSVLTGLSPHFFLLIFLPVFFFLYRHTLRCDFSKCLAIFIGVCAMQTFPIQFANAFDAALNPQIQVAVMSEEAALFGLALSCLMTTAFAWPEIRWFGRMVDRLNLPKLWYATVIPSSLFFAGNVIAMPQFYSTLRVARLPYIFPIVEGFALAVLTLIYLLFFYCTSVILENTELRKRTWLLEMQEWQYHRLLDHMRMTSRLRHDFRHSVRLLNSLAEAGDIESIRQHLFQYADGLSDPVSVRFCENPALNALFSYYYSAALAADIDTQWQIELPDPLSVSELDLASLFGNLMENAIDGCRQVPAENRYFFLTSEVRYGTSLYIVSTNSFDGNVRREGGQYISTKHEGSGLGLASVQAIAEKYGGSAQISSSGTEFYVDVVIEI